MNIKISQITKLMIFVLVLEEMCLLLLVVMVEVSGPMILLKINLFIPQTFHLGRNTVAL